MSAPRYREIKSSQIPVVELDGAQVRIISGSVEGVTGPVTDVAIAPQYLDVRVAAGKTFTHHTPHDYAVIAYIYAGSGDFDPRQEMTADNHTLLVFDPGDAVSVAAGADGVSFLLISGKPLREPVAWQGPIVMNTREELANAYRELQAGTFIKAK
jgi:redox-sensitive bicupin YhaK (pirin superfamily)